MFKINKKINTIKKRREKKSKLLFFSFNKTAKINIHQEIVLI
jgi:hypothetical protein